MSVSLTTNIDKIVFTSPNIPSPSTVGLRSHIIPSQTDLGTWYESGSTMTRVAFAQNIYDISYNTGIDKPVFGISGIVTAGTFYVEGQTNNIFVDTEQTWSLSLPRNAYIDDNSWFVITSMDEYDFADSPPTEDVFLDNNFTSSGTLDSTRDITINGCATFLSPYNYIFNTTQIYRYNPSDEHYTLISQCPYSVSYPTTMIGVSGTLYMFYLDTDNSLIKNIQYEIGTETWSINDNYEYHQTASTLSALKAVHLDDVIKLTLKYSENSVPPSLYIYNYNPVSDSWYDDFIATCGYYNLNFNNALIECDSTYLYSLERSSKLLHKINTNTKVDDQMIIKYETTEQSSTILKEEYLYTYIGDSNAFTKININTETTYELSSPTMSGTDSTLTNESTTLSTDGTYLYLSLNKGIDWNSNTKLYKYDTTGDSWEELDVPEAGSVNFSGKMCKYSNNIYGTDDEYLYTYDTTNDKWNLLSSLPRSGASDSVIAANSTHVYIVISECGYFWRYDISLDTWEVLQSLSLPAPLSYEGTCPGSMLIVSDTIYLGLNYNHVLSTRDTFYYRYSISGETWTSYVAPKTSSNRSFYMLFYEYSGDIYLGGDISYVNDPVDTYTYKVHKCTDLPNNTWEVYKSIDINAMDQSKYVCMYGQYYLNEYIYISFSTATNIGFVCSGPTCRQLDLTTPASDYWMINPIDTHYIIEDAAGTGLYCASTTNGILYNYNIAATTTTKCSTPRKAFVNYFICSTAGSNYLLGKQEIEYDPDLYKYKFYVYKENAGNWDSYDLQEETCTSGSLKLNTIQEYYELDDIVYMASFIRNSDNINVSEAVHKKYDVLGKGLTDFNTSTLTTSITSSGTNLFLAIGNQIKEYDIDTETTTLFQEGIAGNRASAFPYIYEQSGNLMATGNQYFTLSNGGKFITYEYSGGVWSIIDSKDTQATLYNTMDYAEKDDELYIVNTTEQLVLDLQTLDLEYVSSPPYSSICTTTSGGIIVYNDHYACPTYIYSESTFSEISSDVIRTHKSSNLLFIDNNLYFTKNSVTNEISKINTVSEVGSIIYNDVVLEKTPFFFDVSNDVYMLLPYYGTLSTVSGTTITEIKSELDIEEHTSACSDDIDTVYFSKGKDYYLFYKFVISSGTVTQLDNLPEYSSTYSSLDYYDSSVYYVTSNKLYIYNTITETWGQQTTLATQIYSKGIKVDSDYIYYCNNTSIKRINKLHPEINDSIFTPIPVKHHSSFCMDGTDIYLQYCTENIISECTAIIGDEVILTLDLNNISHLTPTAVPYNISLISDVEKEVEFSWEISSTANITHYRVYRNSTGSGPIAYIGETVTLSFTDTLADRGETYYYFVRSCNEYGGDISLSSAYQIDVEGFSYKYVLVASSWTNRKKEINELPFSGIYLWGNSNLTFTDTVRVNITFGEAYNCYITAWDDDSHNSTDNTLLSNECYRVGAVAFATKEDGVLTEPDVKAMYCNPQFNKILKGNDSYYGKFSINYETIPNRYGAYIIFKPILINIPEEELSKGIYEFKTAFHYQYT